MRLFPSVAYFFRDMLAHLNFFVCVCAAESDDVRWGVGGYIMVMVVVLGER